jgi:hypothetical protein
MFKAIFVFICRLLTKFSIIRSKTFIKILTYLPSHVKNIIIIDTSLKYVFEEKSTDIMKCYTKYSSSIIQPYTLYFVIKIWNKKTLSDDHYIFEKSVLGDILKNIDNLYISEGVLIDILYKYIKKYSNNSFFSFLIFDKDVGSFFNKYKCSIAIPNNVTAESLYLYYCYYNKIDNTRDLSHIKCVDYDLQDTLFKDNEIIVSENMR